MDVHLPIFRHSSGAVPSGLPWVTADCWAVNMVNMDYEELVLKNIESFQPVLDGSVIDTAKGIYTDTDIQNMFPSNAALTCLNLACEALYGHNLKSRWMDIIFILRTSDLRKRKPTLGNRLLRNIRNKSDELRFIVDLDKHRIVTEVIFSGSEIGI